MATNCFLLIAIILLGLIIYLCTSDKSGFKIVGEFKVPKLKSQRPGNMGLVHYKNPGHANSIQRLTLPIYNDSLHEEDDDRAPVNHLREQVLPILPNLLYPPTREGPVPTDDIPLRARLRNAADSAIIDDQLII